MPTITALIAMALVPLTLGLGAVAMSDGEAVPVETGAAETGVEVETGVEAATPLRCEVAVTPRPGGVVLEGWATAEGPVSGGYRLRVSKSGGGGSATLVQSGEFAAMPGAPAELGVVSLGGGGHYVAELEATSDDGALTCGDRAQGAL